MLVYENPLEFRFYEITEAVADLDSLLGDQDFSLPAAVKDRFFTAVSSLAEKVDITADGDLAEGIAGSEKDADLVRQDGDSRPRLRLFPRDEGLLAQLVIQPVENCDHRFSPGEGRDLIFGIVKDKRIQAKRDLEAEDSKAQWLIENCPSLARKRGELRDLWSWQFDTPIECLELLRDLAELPGKRRRNDRRMAGGSAFQTSRHRFRRPIQRIIGDRFRLAHRIGRSQGERGIGSLDARIASRHRLRSKADLSNWGRANSSL